MGSHFGFVDLLPACYYLPQRSHLGNYACLRPIQGHRHSQSDQEVGRDSLGSDSSIPGMVEDHGSDVSIEDDYQYPGTERWDTFWQMRMSNPASRGPRYPALIGSPAVAHKPTQDQNIIMEGQAKYGEPKRRDDEQNQSARLSPSTTPKDHRSRTPKPSPRASYSIFPPPCPRVPHSGVPSFSRPRVGNNIPLQRASPSSSNTRRPNVDRNTPSPTSPATSQGPSPRLSATSRPGRVAPTIRAVPPPPGSPVIPFPAIPTEALVRHSCQKPLPDLPIEARATSRRPSLASLRKLSLSQPSTNSSPSLAQLAKTQGHPQGRNQPRLSTDVAQSRPPLRESAIPRQSLRPLPPLPQPEPAPGPPTVSVFDFDDSDAESLADGHHRRFARRLMRGLVSHHFQLRKDKGSHQRSVSDGRPSTSPAVPKTTQGQRTRADTVGDWAGGNRSVDVVREEEDEHCDERQSKENGRPWLTRQNSEVFGRILGRWSA